MNRPRIRYLKGNKGTEGPTSLLFFDSESYMRPATKDGLRVTGTLRLWVAAYVRREGETFRPPQYFRGHTAVEFWALVERLSSWSRPLWAFAHNLGWDLTQLDFWSELERWRWTAGPVDREPHPDTGKERKPWRGKLCLSSRPTFLVLRGSRGILKLIDTGNYWPTKLEAIGDHYGIGKMTAPDFNGDEGPLYTYCERDVDVCRVAVCELLKSWLREDCGVFQVTAPMLAMKNFQHTAKARAGKSDAVNIVLEDDSPSRPLERESYMGGRIEPFYIGQLKGPIYHLDVNSLYPFVMRDHYFPRRRVANLTNRRPDQIRRKLYAYGGIARCLINTGPDRDTYPVRRPGSQVHACGNFWTVLCGPELRRALDHEHVERINECFIYSVCDLFSEWATRWLNRKLAAQAAGNIGETEFCKLILNSLAGKFGQRGDHWTDDPSRAPRRAWGRCFRHNVASGKTIEWRYVAAHVQRREPGREPGNAFPSISAFVTSYAREYMRGLFRLMPHHSLLYSATDSIICTQRGYRALEAADCLHPTEPGKLRLIDTYPEVEICGPNYYRAGATWTRSGHWGRAKQLPNGKWVANIWDQLGGLMGANPRGQCGYSVVELKTSNPSEKNLGTDTGWRVPFRLTLDPEFTDRPSLPQFHSYSEPLPL